jgi:tRNA-2-methylthio-N6-dimethylallyladenosine synthase
VVRVRRQRLERIRAGVPEVAVSTDIIVGFPGETEEDFGGTLRVVEAARFDSAYTFQYSPRPGTRAATLPDQVPKEVVQAHPHLLLTLENYERAADAAVAGEADRFMIYCQRAQDEERTFRAVLKQFGWELPDPKKPR